MTASKGSPSTRRFQFDTVFAADSIRGVATAGRARSAYSSEEVEAIRQDAHEAGRQAALAEIAHAEATALSAIAQSASTLIEHIDRQTDTMKRDSAELALAIARKLAGDALAIAPHAELEGFVRDCLHKLHREARLVITVTPDNAGHLRERIDTLVEQNGFTGRVIIVPQPGMHVTDCRIEWADGGIEKNFEAAFASIQELMTRWQPAGSGGGNQS